MDDHPALSDIREMFYLPVNFSACMFFVIL